MYRPQLGQRRASGRAAFVFLCLSVSACSDGSGSALDFAEDGGASELDASTGGDQDSGAHPTTDAGDEEDSGAHPTTDAGDEEDSGAHPTTDAGDEEDSGAHPTTDAGDEEDSGILPTTDAGDELDSGPAPDAWTGHDCTQLDCDDGDVCTVDSCNPDDGCSHTPRAGAFTLGLEAIELVSTNGSEVEASLGASQDGVDITECATWAYTGPFARLDGSRLVAAPSHGAQGTLSATLADSTISVPVSLKVQRIANSGSLTAEQRDEFEGTASESSSISLLYPENGTVFPLDAKAPVMQWKGGQAADTYRVRLRSTLFEYTDHLIAAAPSRYSLPAEIWQALGASGLGKSDPVQIELLHHGTDGLTVAATQTWRIAQGHINAAVHYRELNGACGSYPGNGRSLALTVGANDPVEVVSQSSCNGCHALTRDGTQMVSSFDTGTPFPFATWDLGTKSEGTPLSARTLIGNEVKGTFAAYSPAGDKLLFSTDAANGNSSLSVYDFTSQTVVARNLLGAKCGEPAWSPDGRLIAGICNLVGGGWVFDMASGDLSIGDVGSDGASVENARVLVAKGNEAGRPSYPDFSPDSQYLIYSRTTSGSRSTGNGRVWLAATDGSFAQALMVLSTQNREFYARFAPRRAGGYYWVAFTSHRDYGHTAFAQAGRRQVWLAAIDDSPDGAEDPSHPAFYLDGQYACASAYELQFTRAICLPDGEECALGTDCCTGTCLAEASDAPALCTTQPEGQCVLRDNACGEGATCCGGLTCVDDVCQQVD